MKKSIFITGLFIFMLFNNLIANNIQLVHNLYNPYLQEKMIQEEISFWKNKMESNSTLVYYNKYASVLVKLYGISGDLEYLFEAEVLLNKALQLHKPQASGIYRSLAHIKIKQHRFCDALEDLLLAENLGDNLSLTNAMFFDVYFELDIQEQIKYYLDMLSGNNDFEYLIRLARWYDAEGKLSDAISTLEKAKLKISENDLAKMNWIYSNLADFYGHDGQIDKAFEYYVTALKLNSADWYSLKGLAWVMYSDNRDVSYALKILDTISERYFIPAVENLRYEILTDIGQFNMAKVIKTNLITKLDHDKYYSSYSSLLFDLLMGNAEGFDRINQVLEVEKYYRESPEYFSKYVQLLIREGKLMEARSIALTKVVDKTYEPDALRRVLEAVKSNPYVYNYILQELKGAKFELGPRKYRSISSELI